MPDIQDIIAAGAGNAWLLLPAALVLGALHALEPGHSKSMMTAFIVAIHGSARQAALLGVSATAGHTIVVWVLALLAWGLGDTGVLDKAEPWLMLIGGVLIVALAVRILFRFAGSRGHGTHVHGHAHHHDHGHHHHHPHTHHHHGHDHAHDHGHGDEDEDAHAAAHAAEIKKRFTGHPVTNTEVIWFGFSGGLLPCPAAFAVLLACLHQKAYALGVVMVAAFSIGLALMLVAVGVAAAWSAGKLRERLPAFDRVAHWAPAVSAAIILVIGIVLVVEGAQAVAPAS